MRIASITQLNPILDRELRQRSRTIRMPIILGLFMLVVLGILYVTHLGSSQSLQFMFGAEALTASARIGRITFEVTALVILGLILLIIPASAATAVNSERDRQTLIPLQVTLLRPSGIFFGKVMSTSALVLLLLIVCMPLMTISFVLGGVSIPDVIATLAMLAFIGICVATVGVSLSSVFRRGAVSTLMAYLFVAALFFGSLIAVGIIAVFIGETNAVPLYLNPVVALSSAAGHIDGGTFDAPLSSVHQEITRNTVWDDRQPMGFPPLWVRTTCPLFVIAVLAAWAGIKSLQTPRSKLD